MLFNIITSPRDGCTSRIMRRVSRGAELMAVVTAVAASVVAIVRGQPLTALFTMVVWLVVPRACLGSLTTSPPIALHPLLTVLVLSPLAPLLRPCSLLVQIPTTNPTKVREMLG